MNSYLTIASKVLSEARQPLSATQILRTAYDLQIVPRDLYGKTQHKTLQARIAEDILRNRGQSEFVRTEKGRFFLRSLLGDPSVNRRSKGEYLAPTRSDQLKRFYVACIRRSALRRLQDSQGSFVPLKDILQLPLTYRLLSTIKGDREHCFLRVIVILCRGQKLLLHRTPSKFGDSLDGKLSIGLIGFVKREDRTLFAADNLGIQEAAERTLFEQLYLSYSVIKELSPSFDLEKSRCIVDVGEPRLENAIAAVAVFRCPTSKKFDEIFSSLSTFEWHSRPTGVNNSEQFDPWSRYMIETPFWENLLTDCVK
jgi:hypothetical protein